MLMDAVENVAVQDADGTLHVGRQAIRDYLSNLTDYKGLTGTLSCTDKTFPGVGTSHGDCATGQALAIFQIGQDQMTGVWPPEVVYTPQ